MSKVYYDHLIVLTDLEMKLAVCDYSPDEKEQVHHWIEETVHYRVMTRVLDNLPKEHHEEFLDLFHQAPHHEGLMEYLKERVIGIEDYIREEIRDIEMMFLSDIDESKFSGEPKSKKSSSKTKKTSKKD